MAIGQANGQTNECANARGFCMEVTSSIIPMNKDSSDIVDSELRAWAVRGVG